jgi:hypothetical protein
MGFISVRLPLGWISQLIALVLVSLAFAFILKLLNLKGFYEILKSPDEQS